MVEWVTKIISYLKLPLPLIWVIFVSDVLFFILPIKFLNTIALNSLFEKNKEVFGLVLLITFVYVSVFSIIPLWNYLKLKWVRHRLNDFIIKSLFNLKPAEKAVLREFYIVNKDVIELPTTNEDVVSLLGKKILKIVSRNGRLLTCGYVFPVTIPKFVKDEISMDIIDFPIIDNAMNNKWLSDNRPDFMSDIAYSKFLDSY